MTFEFIYSAAFICLLEQLWIRFEGEESFFIWLCGQQTLLCDVGYNLDVIICVIWFQLWVL